MNVTVKLFAAARELVGRPEATVAIAANADVGKVRAALAAQWPRLAPLAAQSLVAVNAEYASDETQISENDEIALIPPVSGG